MPRMIQLRNVPEELHRKLKSRAALEGMSLSDYLIGQIRRSAERPTIREFRDRLRTRQAVLPDKPPSEVLRRERDRR